MVDEAKPPQLAAPNDEAKPPQLYKLMMSDGSGACNLEVTTHCVIGPCQSPCGQ